MVIEDAVTEGVLALQLRLDALRQRQNGRASRVALYRIEALLQRLPAQDASVQAALRVRVRTLLDACEASCAASPRAAKAAPAQVSHAFAEVLRLLSQTHASMDAADMAAPGMASAPSVEHLLDTARATWRDLRAQTQLRQALAQPAEDAGPLNSSRLVARTLEAMRAVSPAYLEQFLAYLDVLAGMAALVGEAAVAPATGLPARKPARTRSRKRASKTESISSTPINTETTTD